MGFASSRVRVRFSYIIVVVTFLARSSPTGSPCGRRRGEYDAALPKDASDSVIRGVLSFHQGAGNFPKDFVEVEEAVWKHKKPPNFGDTGRTFNAYNYNYIYFRLGAHECAFYAIPGGARRAEAPSFYYYVTTQGGLEVEGAGARRRGLGEAAARPPGHGGGAGARRYGDDRAAQGRDQDGGRGQEGVDSELI